MKPLRGFQKEEVRKMSGDLKARLWQTDNRVYGRKPFGIVELLTTSKSLNKVTYPSSARTNRS